MSTNPDKKLKLTEEELTFFRNVSDTETGRFLISYIRRIQNHVHDSRCWGPNDTKETAQRAAEVLQELFIDKMRPKHTPPLNKNEFE